MINACSSLNKTPGPLAILLYACIFMTFSCGFTPMRFYFSLIQDVVLHPCNVSILIYNSMWLTPMRAFNACTITTWFTPVLLTLYYSALAGGRRDCKWPFFTCTKGLISPRKGGPSGQESPINRFVTGSQGLVAWTGKSEKWWVAEEYTDSTSWQITPPNS